jgi:hypothetical protein
MNKTPEIEFHLVRRYDGKTVIHTANTLGEFLSFRDHVEADIAKTDSVIGFQSYTIVYPDASKVYADPNRLIRKMVDRTIAQIRAGLYKGE